MSAFIVAPETINAIATAIDMARNDSRQFPSSWVRILEKRHCPTKPAFLGLAMYALNVDAVSQRYPGDETPDSLPGPIDPKAYEYRPYPGSKLTRYAVLKAIHCWLYQCSEGTAPQTPLFQAIERIGHDLAYAIVSELPEYEKLPWR